MSTKRAEAFRECLESQKFRPDHVLIRGYGNEEFREAIREKLSPWLTCHFGFESQQQEDQLKRDALMSLFVFKPKQTGFSAVAEMTTQAINNPVATAIVIMDDDPENPMSVEEREDIAELRKALEETEVQVFDTVDGAVEHINEIADSGVDIA